MEKLKEFLRDTNEELLEHPTKILFINTFVSIYARLMSLLILLAALIPFGIVELIYYTSELFSVIFSKNPSKVLTEYCENALKAKGRLKFDRVDLSNETLHTGLEYFLKYKFFDINHNYNTLYTEDAPIGLIGYTQTYRNKRRSIADIYCICKYYYPNCTPIEVYKILDNMGKMRYIGGSYCSTILKFVYHNQHHDFNQDCKLEYSKLKYSQFSKKILKKWKNT